MDYDGWYCPICSKEIMYDDARVFYPTPLGYVSFCSEKCAREFINKESK